MLIVRKKGQYDQCDTCFSEVGRLFGKRVSLMKTLGIYQKNPDTVDLVAEIPNEAEVNYILEPVANIPWFQIVKSLTNGTRIFSDISQLTGLKAGTFTSISGN